MPQKRASRRQRDKLNIHDIVTSATGLSRIFDGNLPAARRIFWTVIFLTAFSFMCWNIADRVNYFFSYPTMQAIDQESHKSLRFPSISMYIEDDPGIQIEIDHLCQLHNNMTRNVTALPKSEQKKLVNKAWTELQIHYREKSINIRQNILQLFWRLRKRNPNDLFSEPTTYWGKLAFTFNPHANLHVGDGMYLYMVLDLKVNKSRKSNWDRGFRLYIHEPAMRGNSLVKDYIFLQPGKRTNIGIRRSVNVLLDSKCDQRKYLEYVAMDYSLQGCQLDCLIRNISAQFKCYPLSYAPLYPHPAEPIMFLPPCDARTTRYMKAYERRIRDVIIGKCGCRQACTSVSFSPTMSSTVLNAERWKAWYNHKFRSNKSIDYVRENIASVFIQYLSLTETHMTQQWAYTWLSMTSEIGGAFGLAVGACLFSIIEVMEYFVLKMLEIKQKHKEFFSRRHHGTRRDIQHALWHLRPNGCHITGQNQDSMWALPPQTAQEQNGRPIDTKEGTRSNEIPYKQKLSKQLSKRFSETRQPVSIEFDDEGGRSYYIDESPDKWKEINNYAQYSTASCNGSQVHESSSDDLV